MFFAFSFAVCNYFAVFRPMKTVAEVVHQVSHVKNLGMVNSFSFVLFLSVSDCLCSDLIAFCFD